MKPSRGFLSIFDSIVDRVLCVVGAVLLSQGPEFMQQYLQRLGGHLNEARRQLAIFEQTAQQADLSLAQFISQTAANIDPAVAKLGGVMTGAVDRVAKLQAAHDAFMRAELWQRPLVFLRHLDGEIARATAAVYQPAVPTTVEGLVYASAGMILMLALYHLGAKQLAKLFFSRLRTPAAVKTQG